jgi:hypothetical protein
VSGSRGDDITLAEKHQLSTILVKALSERPHAGRGLFGVCQKPDARERNSRFVSDYGARTSARRANSASIA